MNFSGNTTNIFNLKWYAIALFLIGVGLCSVFMPWYLVVLFSISAVLVSALFIKFQWWAYLLTFIIPIMSHKNPGFIVKSVVYNGGREILPLALLLSAIGACAILMRKSARHYEDTIKSPLLIIILIFMSYAFLTVFWSPAKTIVNFYYYFYLILDICIFYFFFHFIDNENFHRRLMWCLAFSGIALAIQVYTSLFYVLRTDITFKISDWLLFNFYHVPMKGQHSGWFVAYSGTAITLNFIIFTAVGLLLSEKDKTRKWLLRIIIIICSLAVFFTGNKGGIWSFVMCSYLYLVLGRAFRKNILRNVLILFIFILVMLAFTMIFSRRGTPRAVSVSTTQASSMGQRLLYWGEGFRQITTRSLVPIGLGIGGFTALNKLKILQPHNLYLHMFFDFGFMGIIIICAIIVIVVKSFLRMKNYQETYLQNMFIAFSVNLANIGLNGLIVTPYYSGTLWFSLAMFFLTLRLVQKELIKIKQVNDTATRTMSMAGAGIVSK